MLECCQKTLKLMQDIDGLADCLKFYLKASPYAVLVPGMASGLLNEGVKATVKSQIATMAIQIAVDKATGADKLPDVKSAIAAANQIKLRRLQAFAQIHALGTSGARHHTSQETKFWNKLVEIYNPDKASGGSGWFGWYSLPEIDDVVEKVDDVLGKIF